MEHDESTISSSGRVAELVKILETASALRGYTEGKATSQDCNDAVIFIIKRIIHYLCHLHVSVTDVDDEEGISEGEDISSSFRQLGIQKSENALGIYLVRGGKPAVVACLKLVVELLKKIDKKDERTAIWTYRVELTYISVRIITSASACPGVSQRDGKKTALDVMSVLKSNFGSRGQQEPFCVSVFDSSLHQLFVRTLKDEDDVYQAESLLKKRDLVSASAAVRYLVEQMTSITNRCLSVILSVALSLTQDTNVEKRLDGIAAISHCLSNSGDSDIRFHGQGIMAALSDSLTWQDPATALAVFPVLAHAVKIIEPSGKLSVLEKPSKAWSNVFERVLNTFITLADARENEKVTAASKLAHDVVAIGQDRIILHLRLFIPAMRLLLEKTASLSIISSTDAFFRSCRALMEAIKWGWPRIPAYYESLIGSLLSAVTRSHMVSEDENRRTMVVLMSAETLVFLRRCGDEQRFDELLGAVEHHPRIRKHQKPVIDVCEIVRGRKEREVIKTENQAWPPGRLAQELFPDGWPRVSANS